MNSLDVVNTNDKNVSRSRGKYKWIYYPQHVKSSFSGYIPEHIVVFEEANDCCMLRWGVVHHRNENKKDNRLENLQGMSLRQHGVLHSTGKKHSEEHRRKIAEKNKGRLHSEETKRKISQSNKGKPSPLRGRKTGRPCWSKGMKRPELSERMKGNQFSKGIIPWNKDRTDVYSQETRLKMSLAKKDYIPWNKGRKASEETRRKMREGWKKRKLNAIGNYSNEANPLQQH